MAKTSKDDDSIANALGLEPIQDFLPAVESVNSIVEFNAEKNINLENDYKYARENLYNVIERGTDALNGIVDLAQQSQHPRSFEVVADLIRTLASANKDLLAIQKQVRELQPEEKGPSKVTNNLFVGSTKDITDLLAGTARQINKKK
jgi:thiamine kinase-like enzyme